jgi:peroxiredoxin
MPCVAEFPRLEDLKAREKKLGCRLFGLEVKGLLKDIRAVVKDKKSTFPILLDDRRYAREALQITGTPTTFVIDKDGRIRARLVGGSDEIDAIVEEVLGKI